MKEYSFLDCHFLKLMRACARKVAGQFKLKYKRFDLFDWNDPDRKVCRGMCYSDGFIYINPRRRRSRKFDPIESAIDTVIHELTHLKYDKHDKKFWAFHKRMKRWFLAKCY